LCDVVFVVPGDSIEFGFQRSNPSFAVNKLSCTVGVVMQASLVDDASKVGNLEIKYVSQSMNNPAFKAKLDKLVKDYQALLAE